MSSSTSKPSIFTSRDAFRSHSGESQRTPPRPPRIGSPFRRQSTPDALERGFLHAAAEAAPLVIHLPENRVARALNVGIGEAALHQPENNNLDTSVWDSFRSAQRREGVSPGNHASKGRSASVSHLITDTPTAETSPTLPSGSGDSHGKKRRAATPVTERAPTSEPSHKRPRLRPPIRNYLPGYRFSTSDLKRGIEPPSPLFFSNSPNRLI